MNTKLNLLAATAIVIASRLSAAYAGEIEVRATDAENTVSMRFAETRIGEVDATYWRL